MRTPWQALCWEYWRTSRGELAIRLLAGLSFAVFMSLLPHLKGETTFDALSEVLRGLVVLVLASTAVTSQAWLVRLSSEFGGFAYSNLYIRPLSTKWLVGVSLMFIVSTSIAGYLLPATLFGWLTSQPMPLLGPSIIVACGVLWFVAASWCPTTMLARLFALLLVGGASIGCMLYCLRGTSQHWILNLGRLESFSFRWQTYLLFGGLAATAIALIMESASLQRRGESWLEWLRRLLVRFDTAPSAPSAEAAPAPSAPAPSAPAPSVVAPVRLPAFSSPLRAELWLAYRKFGKTILVAAGVAAFTIFLTTTIWEQLQPDWRGGPLLWLLALAVSTVVFQCIGVDGAITLRHQAGVTTYSLFDATRPLTSARLIEIRLLAISLSSTAGWLLMVTTCVFQSWLTGNATRWLAVAGPVADVLRSAPGWWWILLTSAAFMLVLSSTSLVLAVLLWIPLHPRLMVTGSCLTMLHVALFAVGARHQWQLQPLWNFYSVAAPLSASLICCTCLARAGRAGILKSRLFAVAVTLWTLCVVLNLGAYWELSPQVQMPAQARWAFLPILLAPLAATVSSPLMLERIRRG